MFDNQGGRCAICGKHQSELNRVLSVDHDHKTGNVRQLLCTKCNAAIGYLNDDPRLCEQAKQYLLKWNCSNAQN